jgi:hypothetical protein
LRVCLFVSTLSVAGLPFPALADGLLDFFGDDDMEVVSLEVAEPFIEMHTGPGRGYPVFHVVEQGESVEILVRKAGWYKIRAAEQKVGWASSTELAHTLEPTGVPVDLPEVGYGDYLKSRWRLGFSSGQLEGANTFALSVGYRPLAWGGVELEGGKVFDQSVTSDFYGLRLLIEPFTKYALSPYLSVGVGEFSFDSRHKVLVESTGNRRYGSAGAGVGYYLGRNVVLMGGYRWYSISSNEGRVGLNSWAIGLSAFY